MNMLEAVLKAVGWVAIAGLTIYAVATIGAVGLFIGFALLIVLDGGW